ncbi:hypothetical protein ACPCHT_04865 [Nucisporomicrobium flavum]|uniref:hypothetical protein n=1 Tax=Nucisporomicrobium flavum TaxID=2785915 RepID=UPI003C2CC542
MWRKAAAVALVTAPIALAVATGVDPALGTGEVHGIYRAHPDATQWHSLLLHWAWVLFVPGMLGLLAPIRTRGAALARVAWVAVLLGLATFSALMVIDFFVLALEQNLPDAQAAAVTTRFEEQTPTMAGWQWPGLAGWALSLVLVPVAAARGRVISWWTAGAALLGTVLYFLFAISPVPVNLLGPVVLAGAYGAAGWQLVTRRPEAGEPDVFGAFRRRLSRICLYAAPAAFALGMLTAPAATSDRPVVLQLSALLLHLGWLLFVPAVLGIAARGRRFTRVAAGVTVVALLHFSALMVGDTADLAARQVLGDAAAGRVGETMGGFPLLAFGWALPGMALSLLGLIAVTVGAATDGLAGRWVPVLTVAGVAAFLVLAAGPAGVAGPLLIGVAFALLDRGLRAPAAHQDRREPVDQTAAVSAG